MKRLLAVACLVFGTTSCTTGPDLGGEPGPGHIEGAGGAANVRVFDVKVGDRTIACIGLIGTQKAALSCDWSAR